GLGLERQPGVLLDAVAGIERCPLDEEATCCGFGGLFAVKMSEISGSLLSRKIACIERSGADTVVATDVSCLMHIAGGLHRKGSPVRVKHIAEVLAGAEK
ncbi:MAG TPA: (Fe-S)-binding protein, partial [Vicinamibacterales bacterium]|nr:(Fe-S)-binding protein [Vicinamibacterales bacterium]